MGPHLPPAWTPSGAPAPAQRVWGYPGPSCFSKARSTPICSAPPARPRPPAPRQAPPHPPLRLVLRRTRLTGHLRRVCVELVASGFTCEFLSDPLCRRSPSPLLWGAFSPSFSKGAGPHVIKLYTLDPRWAHSLIAQTSSASTFSTSSSSLSVALPSVRVKRGCKWAQRRPVRDARRRVGGAGGHEAVCLSAAICLRAAPLPLPSLSDRQAPARPPIELKRGARAVTPDTRRCPWSGSSRL